jgi:signal transduction histidine kinase
MGGLWFGVGGGILVSLFVSMTCLPHVLIVLGQDQALIYDEILEVLLFVLIGPLVGALSDRERRQRALNEELQILAALGETVAFVAHEMKNRVIPIRGFLRRIRRSYPPGGKEASYLEIIERESSKLETMIQDMLSFSRQAAPNREEVELRSLVEEVRQSLHGEFREKGVRLTCMCDGEMQRAVIDRERVSQALVNLLQNALHASPSGKEVRLLAQNGRGFLRIVVEDEGVGIPEGQLDRVFQAFFTTKPRGTGLGLPITQRIVKEHGGEMQVESAPGKGTRVSMSLPVPGMTTPVNLVSVSDKR